MDKAKVLWRVGAAVGIIFLILILIEVIAGPSNSRPSNSSSSHRVSFTAEYQSTPERPRMVHDVNDPVTLYLHRPSGMWTKVPFIVEEDELLRIIRTEPTSFTYWAKNPDGGEPVVFSKDVRSTTGIDSNEPEFKLPDDSPIPFAKIKVYKEKRAWREAQAGR